LESPVHRGSADAEKFGEVGDGVVAGGVHAPQSGLLLGGHGGDEYGRRYAEPVRGVGHGNAVVTPGGRDHSGGRDLAQEQVREGAARLERPRALQLLQFQRDAWAGIIAAGAGQRRKRDCQGSVCAAGTV